MHPESAETGLRVRTSSAGPSRRSKGPVVGQPRSDAEGRWPGPEIAPSESSAEYSDPMAQPGLRCEALDLLCPGRAGSDCDALSVDAARTAAGQHRPI